MSGKSPSARSIAILGASTELSNLPISGTPDPDKNGYMQVSQTAGFSLHAGVMAETHQRQKLERLCRYITRPAVSEQRVSITSNGKVRYELKAANNHLPDMEAVCFKQTWMHRLKRVSGPPDLFSAT